MAEPPKPRNRFRFSTLRLFFLLAWRNLWRNQLRSGITISAMVVGLSLIIMSSALMEGMARQMVFYATNLTLGHLQIHRAEFIHSQDLYALIPDALVDRLENRDGLAVAPRLYAAALASAGEQAAGVVLKGIDPVREARVTSLVSHVRQGSAALEQAPALSPENGEPIYPVVIGFQLARNLRVSPGAELVLITQAADGSIGNGLFRVQGILKPIEPAFDRSGVLLSLEALRTLMALEMGVHELAISAPDPTRLKALGAELADRLVAPEVAQMLGPYGGKLRVRRWDQINPALAGILDMTNGSIAIMGIIIFAIASLSVINTMLMAIHERRREFGVLLALGFARGGLLAMVVLETVMLSAVAALLGALGGSLWAWRLETSGWDLSGYLPDGMDWGGIIIEPVYKAYLLPEHVVLGCALMMFISLVASLLPSLRTLRMNPAAALAH